MKGLILLLLIAGSLTLNAQELDNLRALTEINVENEANAYPYISNDGLRLYYTSDNSGTDDLYFTSRVTLTSTFGEPQLVAKKIFRNIKSSWFSEDELEVYFTTGTYAYYTSRETTASPFNAATKLTLIGNSGVGLFSLSATPNGEELYIRESGVGVVKYRFTSQFTYTMESMLNAPSGLKFRSGQLSKDGLKYYWGFKSNTTNNSDIYTMSRENISDDFGTPTVMSSSINDGSAVNTQPSYASTANVMVWTRASEHSWSKTELYIANYKTLESDDPIDLSENVVPVVLSASIVPIVLIDSVDPVVISKSTDPVVLSESEFDFLAYPNPSSNAVTIRFILENAETVHFVLTDEMGRVVMDFSRDAEENINDELIDLSDLTEGTYQLTLFNDRFTETKTLLKR